MILKASHALDIERNSWRLKNQIIDFLNDFQIIQIGIRIGNNFNSLFFGDKALRKLLLHYIQISNFLLEAIPSTLFAQHFF